MSLTTGSRIGAYEVTAKLGEGGMGEVYRARDTRLNREVALKVLPEAVAADPDRLARFQREAQTLAALNHPNIAQIYGVEDRALVMELVRGEDLASIAARGPMQPADVLPIASQIAEALEAAHDQGIVHRDLKPANVMVREDGTVKVLDFGLAKALDPQSTNSSADLANSPTLTARATQLGMILGTAAYMSPEQAKGKAVDRRADIWAFGVVLYELLSGRRAFEGEDVSTTMAAVLMKDPEWSALPSPTPAALVSLIQRCLERDPKLRLRDIGEARIILNSPAARQDPVPPASPLPDGRRPRVPWIVAAVGLGAGAVAVALNSSGGAVTPTERVQFSVAFPPGVRPLSSGADYDGGVISPDGRLVAFSGSDTATGKVGIYVRRLDAIEATLIKNTEGGRYPFWAPSSRTIAFYAKGKLNRIDIDGTSPLVICDAPTGGWGGAWNSDDVILAGVLDPGPIVKVPAQGGTPQPVTAIESGFADHDWPQFLPDGRHFLYTAWGSILDGSTSFFVGSLDSMKGTLLRSDRAQLHSMGFVEPDWVLSIREGTLVAQRLDTTTLKLQGDPVAIASNANGPIIAARNGTVSYMTTQTTGALNRMVTVNRDGGDERPLLSPGLFADPALSPDGLRLAFAKKDSVAGTFDIWVREMATGVERQLTFNAADDRSPVWSSSGSELFFSSLRQPAGVYRKNANGTGAETRVSPGTESTPHWPYQFHRDGFLTMYGDMGQSYDTWMLSLKESKVTALVGSRTTNETRASVSPDSRWLAYDARETSRFEVFLDTYPPSGTKLPVTTEGGAEAKWSADGKQLYYVSTLTGALMVADVTPGDPPTFSRHRQVHPGPLDWGWNSSHSFDIDPKTGRLVLEILLATRDVTVLMNWQNGLNR